MSFFDTAAAVLAEQQREAFAAKVDGVGHRGGEGVHAGVIRAGIADPYTTASALRMPRLEPVLALEQAWFDQVDEGARRAGQ